MRKLIQYMLIVTMLALTSWPVNADNNPRRNAWRACAESAEYVHALAQEKLYGLANLGLLLARMRLQLTAAEFAVQKNYITELYNWVEGHPKPTAYAYAELFMSRCITTAYEINGWEYESDDMAAVYQHNFQAVLDAQVENPFAAENAFWISTMRFVLVAALGVCLLAYLRLLQLRWLRRRRGNHAS